ncbi:OST-HTH/LOTUS domain-containing protein [Candidatus Skiveiella danica]|uniref:OST-HTH/LOTUS domain-containing protein n=1 Tax=Candidatus Skiveiella danica TaxID=3386177 RepID=UPI001D277BFF|nr:OST-HTH/LOTUS domain-containing protein [Betaproteobacteria bacterium]
MNVVVPDVKGVDWPSSRIVQLLKGEEEASAVESWTLLNAAIPSIRAKEPEQTPKQYGCSSWREVIHKSQLFEIRKTKSAGENGTLVWYRSKPMRFPDESARTGWENVAISTKKTPSTHNS